jgi:hypothetical protein
VIGASPGQWRLWASPRVDAHDDGVTNPHRGEGLAGFPGGTASEPQGLSVGYCAAALWRAENYRCLLEGGRRWLMPSM